jgi:hypothetical protein
LNVTVTIHPMTIWYIALNSHRMNYKEFPIRLRWG